MSEHWGSYFSEFEGCAASILVDMEADIPEIIAIYKGGSSKELQ